MKLELKDITPYLPYALDIEIINYQCDYVGIRYSTITGCYHIGVMPHFNYEGGSTGKSFDEFKPLFLPISALTEQLPDGSIPIVELAKIAGYKKVIDVDKNGALVDYIEDGSSYYVEYLNYNQERGFYLLVKDDKYTSDEYQEYINRTRCNQLALFEYLYANHFWLGDQSYFDKGIIIDKRTVKTD